MTSQRRLCVAAICIALAGCSGNDAGTKTWIVSATVHGKPLTLRASARFAGAIDSVVWDGTEFIDRADHGRELQSAVSFDRKRECLNPTEAGSAADHSGPTSSSALLSADVSGSTLTTSSIMAYWVSGDAVSPACAAGAPRPTTALSDYRFSKTVTVGADAISHEVVFSLPRPHNSATFEALTAYLPVGFSSFWTFDPKTDAVAALEEGRGEQPLPIIFSTPARDRALGVIAKPAAGARGPTYGRWRFPTVVKWNCVFRKQDVAAGDHAFTCWSVIGTFDQVRQAMKRLAAASNARGD